MQLMLMFPGQGAQRVGMLHTLPSHPETTRTLQEAGHVLAEDALQLDTADALASTRAVQLCLLIAGVAQARILAAEGRQADMVAGLSIGAFPAAVTAGALTYQDALSLVALRGHSMQAAFPSGYGMAAIEGLTLEQTRALITQAHHPEAPVYLANLNSADQFILAGHHQGLQAALALATQQGARRTHVLDMSVPSHCELLEPVAQTLRAAFTAIRLQRPRCRYLSASRARALTHPQDIADDLATNAARPTYWHDTARLAWEYGARLAIEMPGGSVLSRLTAPVLQGGRVLCSDNTPLDTLLTLARRTR